MFPQFEEEAEDLVAYFTSVGGPVHHAVAPAVLPQLVVVLERPPTLLALQTGHVSQS